MKSPLRVPEGLDQPLRELIGLSLEEIERRFILATIAACHGHRGRAAQSLGVTTRTLANKMKAWRLQGQIPSVAEQTHSTGK